jgi:DNA modification methylase
LTNLPVVKKSQVELGKTHTPDPWGSMGYHPAGRNKRSVWTVNTRPFADAHFATFPPKLIEPCILAGCPIDGLVLDPFMGAGTVATVCKSLKRNYVGFELNPTYVDTIAINRVDNTMTPLFVTA